MALIELIPASDEGYKKSRRGKGSAKNKAKAAARTAKAAKPAAAPASAEAAPAETPAARNQNLIPSRHRAHARG